MYSIKVTYNDKENYWVTQVLDDEENQIQASYSSDISDRDEDIKIYQEVFNIGEVHGIDI